MHGAHVPGDVLLSFARVAALRARDGLVVAMAQKVSLQCALVRELQPTRLAQMCAACMLFPHMQVESARAFKSTSAFVANDRSHVRVDGAVSLQITWVFGRVGTQGAAMHHSFLFHASYNDYRGKRSCFCSFRHAPKWCRQRSLAHCRGTRTDHAGQAPNRSLTTSHPPRPLT